MADPGPFRPADLLFPDRRNSIENNICDFCKRPAESFRDGISKKEYSISGLCQHCQDSVFDQEPFE